MTREQILNWLDEQGSTPELIWQRAEEAMNSSFEIERKTKDRSQEGSQMQLALMNQFLRGILVTKTTWEWLDERSKSSGIPELWQDYEATGKENDAKSIRDIYLNGLASLRRESCGTYNPVPQFFAGKIGPQNNDHGNAANRWVGGLRYPEIRRWVHDEVAPLCKQTTQQFDETWRPATDIDDFIRAAAEEAGAERRPDGTYVMKDTGEPFQIQTEQAEQFGQMDIDLDEVNSRLGNHDVPTYEEAQEADQTAATKRERFPTDRDIDIIVNPIYQNVLSRESTILQIVAHDPFDWRTNKKPALSKFVKSTVGTKAADYKPIPGQVTSHTMLLRQIAQKQDPNNHRADLLVRHKIVNECAKGVTLEELKASAEKLITKGSRINLPLWQLSLLDVAETQLGITENRPSRALAKGEVEAFIIDRSLAKTPTHANFDRCVQHLSDRFAEISTAGKEGWELTKLEEAHPEAFNIFQELERRYGSTEQRIEQRLSDLEVADPTAYHKDGYNTTRTAKSYLSEMVLQRLHQAITKNPAWSDKARALGDKIHAKYYQLKMQFESIENRPEADPEYKRLSTQMEQSQKEIIAKGKRPEDDADWKRLREDQEQMKKAITNNMPSWHPYYERDRKATQIQIGEWTKTTLLEEREKTKDLSPEAVHDIDQMLTDARNVLQGANSRIGLYTGKNLDYSDAAAKLWKAHLLKYDEALESLFPQDQTAAFSVSELQDQLVKINDKAIEETGQRHIPKSLMAPPRPEEVQKTIENQFWEGMAQTIAYTDRRTFTTVMQEALAKGNDDYYTAEELNPLQPGTLRIKPNYASLAPELARRTNAGVVADQLRASLQTAHIFLQDPRINREFNRYALSQSLIYDLTLQPEDRLQFTINHVRNHAGVPSIKTTNFVSAPAAQVIGRPIGEVDVSHKKTEQTGEEVLAR